MVYISSIAIVIYFLEIFRAKIKPEGEFVNKFSTYISFTLLAFVSSSIILVSNSVISCFCLQTSASNCSLSEIHFLIQLLYKTSVKILSKRFPPFIIIEDLYLQTFLYNRLSFTPLYTCMNLHVYIQVVDTSILWIT